MQSDTKDFASMADDLVEWFTLRWRAILYSFTAGVLVTIACAMCAAAQAYTKPPGAPELLVPNYGVTITVFAAQTPVGHGIGIFERKPDGTLYLCGICIIPEYPTMDGPVAAAGGPGPYVESKRSEINAILASRYPAIGGEPTGSTIDKVNAILSTNTLRMVNGAPALAPW